MQEAPLGGLSAQAFLRHYWQRRPLLVRRALPPRDAAIRQRALFALAARDDVESRLVARRGARWRVTQGPIAPARLARAGARGWTLLVNGVDHHCAAAERLLRRFAFLSEARLDDVMVSYAAPGGGVGPHFDSYDVFLVQGSGTRVWRLARPRRFALVAGAPLKLIAGFRAEDEVLLEAGDLLYLPPGWAHDGVALEPSLTSSIGFRAPGGAELAVRFLDYLHERGFADAAFRDPGRRASLRPASIDASITRFAERQLGRIRWRRAEVAEFVGRLLSEPRPAVLFAPRARRARSIRGRQALLEARTRMLYRGARFFVNGESLRVGPRQRAALAALADARRASGTALARAGLEPRILDWHAAGYLRLERRR